jgi:hypothetical protein
MSLEYEAWCASEPDLAAVSRTASLVMSFLLDIDNRAVVATKDVRSWNLHWGDSVFVVVDVMGPEIAGRWSLAAEAGRRGAR